MTITWLDWSLRVPHQIWCTLHITGVSFSRCSHLLVLSQLILARSNLQIQRLWLLLGKRYSIQLFKKKRFLETCLNIYKNALFLLFLYQVYIHCSTSLCQPSLGNNCEPRCFRKSEYEIFPVVIHHHYKVCISLVKDQYRQITIFSYLYWLLFSFVREKMHGCVLKIRVAKDVH